MASADLSPDAAARTVNGSSVTDSEITRLEADIAAAQRQLAELRRVSGATGSAGDLDAEIVRLTERLETIEREHRMELEQLRTGTQREVDRILAEARAAIAGKGARSESSSASRDENVE